jgi:hypothetical protein
VSTDPPAAPLMPYTDLSSNNTMTLETANLIWNACYGSTLASETADGWERYTSAQRLQAIETRDAAANGGHYGIWHISDRH